MSRRGVSGGAALQIGPRGRITIAPGARLHLGSHITIAPDVTIVVQGQLQLGDGVFIGQWSNVVCYDHVTIGAGSRLAERVSVHDNNHVFEPLAGMDMRRDDWTAAPIEVGMHVWLAANVVVTSGRSIGSNTVVAANSVVSRDLPADVLAAGTPAGVIRPLRP